LKFPLLAFDCVYRQITKHSVAPLRASPKRSISKPEIQSK